MCVCMVVCVIVSFSLAAGAATPGWVETEREERGGESKGGGGSQVQYGI